MNITKVIILGISFLICSHTIDAQSFFQGSIIAGVNGSQIDGDQLAGYHKFGMSAGIKVEFPLNSILDMGIEFLFSQRGSRSEIIPNQFNDVQRIHLNYAELPIFIKWNDWWVEKDSYYKFHLHAGLSPARLISSQTNFSPSAINGSFSNYDISFLLGGGFSFTKDWTLSARFTRSINRLYSQTDVNQSEISGLLGYFITVRGEYTF
jgi:hypothetical protein